MVKPARSDWVAISFALLGVPLFALQTATALIWIALWLGTAVMLVASRHRAPRFVPLRPPVPEIQNLDSARIEGSPSPWGWYWMLFPLTLTLAVAPAALLSPTQGIMAFGIPCALNLLIWLGFAVAHDRGSARIVDRLVHAGKRRVLGVISQVHGQIIRRISRHVWAGTHHGSTQVESVYGGVHTVGTVTPTTNSMGYREEQRHGFVVTPEPSGPREAPAIEIHPEHMLWAATIVPGGGKADATPLRRIGIAEEHALRLFPRVGSQTERIRVGDRVVIHVPDTASAEDPVLVYASPGKTDPLTTLRTAQRVRRLSIVGIAACLIACVLAMVLGPT